MGLNVVETAAPIASAVLQPLQLMSGLSEATRSVVIGGTNISPDAEIFVSVDHGPLQELPITSTSSTEIREPAA